MRNIELKATLDSLEDAARICEALGAVFDGAIHQIDTYFCVSSGRLKLREAQPGDTELIYYERPDCAGPKGCDYHRHLVDGSLKESLAAALGIVAVVDKTRQLYLWENVRIHLDCVAGLGQFIEFEAVLGPDDDDHQGTKKLQFLTETFKLDDDAQQIYSYLELVQSVSGA